MKVSWCWYTTTTRPRAEICADRLFLTGINRSVCNHQKSDDQKLICRKSRKVYIHAVRLLTLMHFYNPAFFGWGLSADSDITNNMLSPSGTATCWLSGNHLVLLIFTYEIRDPGCSKHILLTWRVEWIALGDFQWGLPRWRPIPTNGYCFLGT